MVHSQRFKSLVVVVILIAAGLAVIYGLSRTFGIVWGILLTLASLPMSLLIPVAAIRYGVLGAWLGAFVGYVGCIFSTLFFIGMPAATAEMIGPWVMPLLVGGGVIGGASIGVGIAFRQTS